MAHLLSDERYRKLQRRMDANPIGAPDSQALRDILSIMYSPAESDIAVQMPYAFSSTRKLARITGIKEAALQPQLEAMAEKGLVFDLERKGRNYWYLNPLVIGLFEFSMMRIRGDFDQAKLGNTIHEFLFDDPDKAMLHEMTAGPTQLSRTLVHEAQLDQDVVEVLDYERASHYIRSSDAWSVEMCHCRHIAHHRGTACDNPMEMCMSFGQGAKYFARRGLGRSITKEEALDILEQARERGLVQLGDNVQNNPMFICNCCSCCCGFLEGYRQLKEMPMIQTSNFVARVAADTCNRCGKCAKNCPVGVFTVQGKGKERRIDMDVSSCIGCGACATLCPTGAITMTARPARVHTPVNTMERVLTMALERGKLQYLLFDDPNRVSHTVMRNIVGAVFKMPPAKQLLAQKQLKSRFIGWATKLASYKPQPEL